MKNVSIFVLPLVFLSNGIAAPSSEAAAEIQIGRIPNKFTIKLPPEGTPVKRVTVLGTGMESASQSLGKPEQFFRLLSVIAPRVTYIDVADWPYREGLAPLFDGLHPFSIPLRNIRVPRSALEGEESDARDRLRQKDFGIEVTFDSDKGVRNPHTSAVRAFTKQAESHTMELCRASAPHTFEIFLPKEKEVKHVVLKGQAEAGEEPQEESDDSTSLIFLLNGFAPQLETLKLEDRLHPNPSSLLQNLASFFSLHSLHVGSQALDGKTMQALMGLELQNLTLEESFLDASKVSLVRSPERLRFSLDLMELGEIPFHPLQARFFKGKTTLTALEVSFPGSGMRFWEGLEALPPSLRSVHLSGAALQGCDQVFFKKLTEKAETLKARLPELERLSYYEFDQSFTEDGVERRRNHRGLSFEGDPKNSHKVWTIFGFSKEIKEEDLQKISNFWALLVNKIYTTFPGSVFQLFEMNDLIRGYFKGANEREGSPKFLERTAVSRLFPPQEAPDGGKGKKAIRSVSHQEAISDLLENEGRTFKSGFRTCGELVCYLLKSFSNRLLPPSDVAVAQKWASASQARHHEDLKQQFGASTRQADLQAFSGKIPPTRFADVPDNIIPSLLYGFKQHFQATQLSDEALLTAPNPYYHPNHSRGF